MNQEPGSKNWTGVVPPSVEGRLRSQLAGKEVFSAEHLVDKCKNPLTGESLKLKDLQSGRIIFWMNLADEVSAVYRLIGLHPTEPADKNMWVLEPLPLSRAYNLAKIKKIRQSIIDRVFEDLHEGDDDLLVHFEAGERISLPAHWQGKVAMALQDQRLFSDEGDQIMELFFE